MRCPFCGAEDSRVVDSRPVDGENKVRRRRVCPQCKRRFQTYEEIGDIPLIVVKRSGERQLFTKKKLINSMVRACGKRSVPMTKIEAIADSIEMKLMGAVEREIETTTIGEMVMERLKKVDEVAYIRYASVYRQFKDAEEFMDELEKLLAEKKQSRSKPEETGN